ncbi:MAG: aldehyde dehydrogenase family protein [Myxococcota bacterium]|nr:aldehyde dehydrogenase family protein [Myxococcota bacterium]
MTVFGNYIGGQWVSAKSGATFERRNPADTRDCVGLFVQSSARDVEEAVTAARLALPGWRRLTPDARAQFFFKAAYRLLARKEEIAAAITREEGKSLAEATSEAGRGAVLLRHFAGEGLRSGGEVLPSASPSAHVFTERVPLGVIGLITAWSFPLAIPLWKAASAMVYGNSVVLKPSPLSPHTAHLLAEIFHEAGLPPGVFNLVQGGAATGEALVACEPTLDGVSFTGSVAAGRLIAHAAIERGTRYQLEMGSRNPVVILEDADLDQAVELTVQGAMRSAGEQCTATARAIVVDGVADEFSRRVTERVKRLELGPGTDPAASLGPVISEEARERILAHIARALSQGARLLCGGSAPADSERLKYGHYVLPTVLDHVQPTMAIAKEEVLGPVLAIVRVADFEAALRLANDVPFGLSATVFTRDIGAAFSFAREAEAGMIRVNGEYAGVEPQAPSGGMKSSASFSREQTQAAKDFFTRAKTVFMDKAGR